MDTRTRQKKTKRNEHSTPRYVTRDTDPRTENKIALTPRAYTLTPEAAAREPARLRYVTPAPRTEPVRARDTLRTENRPRRRVCVRSALRERTACGRKPARSAARRLRVCDGLFIKKCSNIYRGRMPAAGVADCPAPYQRTVDVQR
ncbi:hypothetical protein EVAR_18322_1 [Eumeta japonica]|uniref:Uncharacterized protein n=1 Tax=Eumeta variegata TaxID=151549 RepID=A0A4C1VA90_EUMVA|nr:hypothetical protein EVAR_18322_1 [Eumeta japonica]